MEMNMGKNWKEKILILAKTYPSQSSKYVETSCVAGINEDGVMRRLFPVPFRMISDAQQFKKWQWVDVCIAKVTHDHRNESHKIYVGTIDCQNVIDSKKDWIQRRPWLNKIPTFNSIDALNSEEYILVCR